MPDTQILDATTARVMLDTYHYTPINRDPSHPLCAAILAMRETDAALAAAKRALDAAPLDGATPYFAAYNRASDAARRNNAAYYAAFADAALTYTATIYTTALTETVAARAAYTRTPSETTLAAYTDALKTQADADALHTHATMEYITHHRKESTF